MARLRVSSMTEVALALRELIVDPDWEEPVGHLLDASVAINKEIGGLVVRIEAGEREERGPRE